MYCNIRKTRIGFFFWGENPSRYNQFHKISKPSIKITVNSQSSPLISKMALNGAAPQRGTAAATALRRRRTTSGGAASGASGTMLQFYTDDAPGLKISPNVVLVMSIGFIAFVAVLHVMGKLYFAR
ncbi:hypothetical protein Leryth_015484 [Lithospermum erythrorhizon]|nr:hypothetical protein Leryth_015484 [Lithospermum erythrorhizon]